MSRGRLLSAGALFVAFTAPSPPVLAQARRPKIAVVIDDFGITSRKNVPDRYWMEIPWPVSFAVMPESPRTRKAARETLQHGHELLIHFPFDPFLDLSLRPDRVYPGDAKQVEWLFKKAMKEIPGAKGLNNHRSLKATQNRPLMAWFMKFLKPTGLYFVDSRVSAKSVAYDEARKEGLRTARLSYFLDTAGVHSRDFCRQKLRLAAVIARKKGSVLVIGHHYFWATYKCLVEEVPELQKEGYDFVFASQVAKAFAPDKVKGAGGGSRTHTALSAERF